jgi:hypothetical protein
MNSPYFSNGSPQGVPIGYYANIRKSSDIFIKSKMTINFKVSNKEPDQLLDILNSFKNMFP